MDHYQLFINGTWRDGSDGQTMQSVNPATGKPWASFACASAADVEQAVHAARAALDDPAWAGLTATERGKLLFKLADLVAENSETLGAIETRDSGKLAAETRSQAGYVADYYRYYGGYADKIQGAVYPIDKPDMHVYSTPVPIGVVAAIVPWNAQMFLTATKLGPALAAGCTVILKASEMAPCAMFEFGKLVEEAGFPPGVVSVITGDAENCAIPLTRHPDIDRIAFTGGPETARHVIRNSAENFAVTTMELGGKSPLIIFDDANLDSAANGLIAGNFGASGQSCVAGSRGLVHRSVKDKVIELVREKMKTVTIGDPLESDTQIGPLCTLAQVDRIKDTLAKSVSQGATIHIGGSEPAGHDSGHFFEPTLVECATPETETLKIEMFGPVMSILPFDTEAEAIALANDSDFGLGSGIFTENLARAHRVSSKIRSGICWINTYRAISPIAPFGGFNQSGYGREAGIDAIQDYVRMRTVWVNTSAEPMANPFVVR